MKKRKNNHDDNSQYSESECYDFESHRHVEIDLTPEQMRSKIKNMARRLKKLDKLFGGKNED